MTTERAHWLLTLLVGFYRRLLCLYPAAFRQAYGPAMVQVFRDLCRAALRQQGPAGVLRIGGTALVDLPASLTEQWLQIVPRTSRERLRRWGSVASLVGGLLWILAPQAPGVFPLAYAVAMACFLIALAGLAVHGAGRAGLLGYAGTALAASGAALLLLTVLLVAGFGLLPAAVGLFVGGRLLYAGMVLVSLAHLRARVLSWSSSLLLTAGALSALLLPVLGSRLGWWADGITVEQVILPAQVLSLLFGSGWVLLGITLWSAATPRIWPGRPPI